MTTSRLAAWVRRADSSAGLNRARALAHAAGRRVAFWIDNACVAGGVLSLLSLSLAGFELPKAARLWGGFWTHYADASEAARAPVLTFMMAAWLIATVLVAFCRAPKNASALPCAAKDDQ